MVIGERCLCAGAGGNCSWLAAPVSRADFSEVELLRGRFGGVFCFGFGCEGTSFSAADLIATPRDVMPLGFAGSALKICGVGA